MRGHPFLFLIGVIAAAFLLLFMWQLNPACRAWNERLDKKTAETMEGYGYVPGGPPLHEEQDDLSVAEIRRQLGERAARALADERPVACL